MFCDSCEVPASYPGNWVENKACVLKPEDVRSGESPGNTVNILVVINRLKGKPFLGGSSEAILKKKKKERQTDGPLLESLCGVLRHDFEILS